MIESEKYVYIHGDFLQKTVHYGLIYHQIVTFDLSCITNKASIMTVVCFHPV